MHCLFFGIWSISFVARQKHFNEDNTQIYAAKYLPCLSTEEELKRELRLDDFEPLGD